MTVLLCLGAMLAASYLAGYALLFRQQVGLLHPFRAHIGYCYLLVMFYVAYVITHDMAQAVLTTVILPVGYFVLRYLLTSKPANAGDKVKHPNQSLLIAIFAVAALAAWPHIATGWGSYWHNGNYDIEDGLNGRDAYVKNLIFGAKDFSLKQTIGDGSKVDFSEKTGTTSLIEKPGNSFYEWYAGDGFRLQYSNLAFWSHLLQQRNGMDIVIVHALLNLLLATGAVYTFSRAIFQLKEGWSALAAFGSVGGSFYLGTFWAGHIGSLMYGSVIPMLATLILASKGTREWRATLPWIALGVAAMAFTYPQALMVGMAYLIGYRMYASGQAAYVGRQIKTLLRPESGGRFLWVFVVLALVCAMGYGLWLGTESYRLRQDGEYRAWGLVHDIGIAPIFFGFAPSPSGLFNATAYWGLTSLGLLMTAWVLYACYAYRGVQKQFVRFFVPIWLLGLLFFYVFIRDSYYIYKYLYTHFFFLVVIFTAYVAALNNWKARIVAGVVIAANAGSDVVAGQFVYNMSHNHQMAEYEQLASWGKGILSKTFIDLIGGEAVAVRQTMKRHSIETELDPRFADYFIVRKSSGGDITGEQLGEVLFSTRSFEIRRSPEKNYLMVRTWFEPEVFPRDPVLGSMPYRWVGQGKNDNVGIYVIRPDHQTDMAEPFLRICGQKGPSATGLLSLQISDGSGKKVDTLFLEGSNCAWLPSAVVKDVTQPLILRTGAMGRKLSPPEDRTLLYRIFSIAWSKQRYDAKAVSLLNPQGGDSPAIANPAVKFGNGWWPPETYDGVQFRWATDGAEMLVSERCGKTDMKVSIDMEIGPSHGSARPVLSVTDGKGKVLNTMALADGRQTVKFSVPQPGTYRLTTGSEGKRLSGDYRILDFRVFALHCPVDQ